MSLRLALLLAGILLVAVVYVWGVLRKRHRTRGHYRQRLRPFRPPEQRITLPTDDFEDDDPNFEISAVRVIPAPQSGADATPALAAPSPKAPEPAFKPRPPVLAIKPRAAKPGSTAVKGIRQPVPAPHVNLLNPKESATLDELPVVTHEPPPRPARPSRKRKVDQMAFAFDGSAAPPPPPPQPEAQVLSLLLQAPRGKAVSGPNLIKAMNTVGLRYGEMRIFHHFGAGELRTETPLFSVANMFEPGYFDLDNLEAFATEGIALFMQLPSPLDGAVAFELFLNTAQRLAEALNVDIYSDPGKPLDSAAIDRMRRIAGRYGS